MSQLAPPGIARIDPLERVINVDALQALCHRNPIRLFVLSSRSYQAGSDWRMSAKSNSWLSSVVQCEFVLRPVGMSLMLVVQVLDTSGWRWA